MPDNKNTLSTPDIQNLLKEYQTGMASISNMDLPRIGRVEQANPYSDDVVPLPELPTFNDRTNNEPLTGYVGEDYTEEARRSGYGLSRYDKDYSSGMDLEDSRAREQSNFAKIGSGLLKGGVTAVSTALNTTLGTVFGLGSSLFELAFDADGDGRGVMDTLDAGVNNWLSNQLVKLQNYSEELFPNYRTAEERSEEYQKEWYKHMGTANFIGDSLLKNFGFTVGAMAGGLAWTKLIGAGLSKQLANDVMKGAVAAAEGDAEAGALLKEAADALMAGERNAARSAVSNAVKRADALKNVATAGVNTDVVVSNVQNAARALNKYGAKMGLYGAIIGAMGEGTVEGIMAKNEFVDEYRSRIQEEFAMEYNNLENEILNSGNWDWLIISTTQTPDGGVSGSRQLSEAGQEELSRRRQETINKYNALLQQVDEEGDRVASTTYLLNLPILTTSNVIQFGRMLSGGWTTAKNAAASSVRGSLSTSAGEKGAVKLSADYASKYGKGSIAGKTILGSLKNAGTEAFEEMSQGAVSSGAKQVADANLTSFNDAGYDAEAIGSVRDWFSNMYQGGRDYLTDIKNWQEGALGALTGLFGIPGKRWNGGVAEAYREARDEVQASRNAANKLNETVNSEEFQTRWNNYIRHLAFDNEMGDALQRNDQYAWKSANDAQLINDIMMFADAGKLDDLNQMVDAMGNMTEDQAGEILDMSKDESGELPAYLKKKSKSDIVESVAKQASTIKDKIKEYKDFYDTLSARLPLNLTKDQRERLLKELTFTAQQIKGFEARYLSMLDETEEMLKSKMSSEEQAEAGPLFAAVRRAYSGGFPIISEDLQTRAMEEQILNRLEKDVEAQGDEALKTKVSDMRKLSDDRRAFYRKLVYLQTEEGQNEFNEKSVSQEKINNAAEEAAVREETKSYNTVEDVKKAYFNLRGTNDTVANERANFIRDLRSKKGVNKAVDDFVELYDANQEFRTRAMAERSTFLENEGLDPSVKNWVSSIYNQMAVNLLNHNVNSIEDMQRLDPDAFMSSAEMTGIVQRDNSFISGIDEAKVASMMGKVQEFLRDVMEDFFKEKNSATIARSNKTIKSGKTAKKKTGMPGLGTVGIDSKKGEQVEEPVAQAEEEVPDEYSREKDRVDSSGDRGRDVRPTSGEMTDLSVPPVPESQDMDIASRKTDGKWRFYEGAMPEMSIDRQKARREAFKEEDTAKRDEMLKAPLAQIVEFSEDKGTKEKPVPSDKAGEGEVNNFSKIGRALKRHNAYDNMNLLRKGDRIKFVMFENEDIETGGFPKINGERVVLMCTEKVVDGEKKLLVLNVLSSGDRIKQYFGLEGLREDIQDEFDEKGFTNGIFEFSKTSPVWALRSGFMEYGQAENPIVNLPGYDKKAPIVFIDSDGEVHYMINTPSGSVIDRKFERAEQLFPKADIGSLAGNFYYLVYDNDGYKIPVRLNQEHFNKDSMAGTTAPFVAVRNIVQKIVTTAQNAQNNVPSVDPIPGEKSADRKNRIAKQQKILDQYRKELSGYTKELDKVLDLHRDAITLGFNMSDGQVSLKITPDAFNSSLTEEEKKNGKKADYFYGDDLTVDSVLNSLARLDRAFNVSINSSEREFKQKVNDGVLTTNAKRMRQIGMNFYTFPYFPSAGAFKKGSTLQDKIKKNEYSEAAVQEQQVQGGGPAESNTNAGGVEDNPFMWQIVGSRPSAVSEETRAMIAEAKKESKKRRAKVKSELYNMLQKGNSVSNMRMSDKKLKEKLKHVGISAPVIDFIINGIQQYPHLRDLSPYETFMQLDSLMRYDIADEYNRSLGEKLDEKLNDYLISFLAKYGIRVRTEDLERAFGQEGAAGAYDVIEKIIYLSDNPDLVNKITFPEEFAHAFVELMGSSLGYGADSDDFQFLYETVADTRIYEQVYDKYKGVYVDENGKPDEYRIRKEAIGQALAAAIVHNWEQADESKRDGSFFARMKEWFQKILDLFKGANISFEQTIDDISKEILAGDTRRLDKVDDQDYSLLDYTRTLVSQTERDGGKAVNFMKYFSSIGNLITGSLAYRRQGTVYRSKLDSLHDIDMIVPAEIHGIHNVELLSKYGFKTRNNLEFVNDILSSPYFRKIAERYPKMVFANVYNSGHYITVNAVYSEDENLSKRFASLTGSYASRLDTFTEDEREQIYLFDFFLRTPEDNNIFVDEENGLNLVDYRTPFREKLKMGRAKDIYDYQRWRLFDEFQGRRSDPRDLLFQVTTVDYGEEALKQHKEQVLEEVSEATGIFEEDRDNIATALTVMASKGPDTVELAKLALDNWSRPNVSLEQDTRDFGFVFNSIFSDSEKRELADAISSAYSLPVEQVNLYQIEQDYTMWKLSGIIDKGTDEDKDIMKSAFERMQSLETSHGESSILLSRVSQIVKSRRNRPEQIQIGMVPDTSTFDALSDETKNGLLARKWTKEEYNNAPKEVQDKAIRCIGV